MKKNNKVKVERNNGKNLILKNIGVVYMNDTPHEVFLCDSSESYYILAKISHTHSRVYINKNQSGHVMLISLIHELLHSIFYEYQANNAIGEGGVGPGVSQEDSAEEKLIRTLDSPITSVFILDKRNQEFFKRVLSGEFCE